MPSCVFFVHTHHRDNEIGDKLVDSLLRGFRVCRSSSLVGCHVSSAASTEEGLPHRLPTQLADLRGHRHTHQLFGVQVVGGRSCEIWCLRWGSGLGLWGISLAVGEGGWRVQRVSNRAGQTLYPHLKTYVTAVGAYRY